MSHARKALCVAVLGVATLTSAHAATETSWRYSMTGASSDRLLGLAGQFDKSQSDYKIAATCKGGDEQPVLFKKAAR